MKIGDRCHVAPVSSVAEYLWNHAGTVEEIRPARPYPHRLETFVIALDEPHPKPTEHWTPLTHIGLTRDQIG